MASYRKGLPSPSAGPVPLPSPGLVVLLLLIALLILSGYSAVRLSLPSPAALQRPAASPSAEREEERPPILTRDGVVVARDRIRGEVKVALDLILRRYPEPEQAQGELAAILERISLLTGRPLSEAQQSLARYQARYGADWFLQPPAWVRARPLVVFSDLSEEELGRLRADTSYAVFLSRRRERYYPFGRSYLGRLIGWHSQVSGQSEGLERVLDRVEGMTDPGQGLTLTIDYRIQGIVESALDQAVKKYLPRWAQAVVMNPNTGELLAVASYPDFDPGSFSQELARRGWVSLPLTEVAYEPGSIMKPLVAAFAHDRRLVELTRSFRIPPEIVVDGFRVGEAEASERFGRLTMGEMLVRSSNVGMAKVALAMGQENLEGMVQAYALTEKTRLELPQVAGLDPGRYEGRRWSRIKQANLGFGQGIMVTTPALLRAWAALANGGVLVEPRIVAGNLHYLAVDSATPNLTGRRVLEPETVEEVRQYLIRVAEEGTGTRARLPGVTIAGKTGTGQVYEPGQGYVKGKYLSSFIGFFPAQSPRYLVLVQLMEPQGGVYYGGEVAAPVFRQIAQGIISLEKLGKLEGSQTVGPGPQ